jgi:hypothetical protein
MTNAANASHFEQPQARLIAAGFDVEKWLNDGQGVGTGGIVIPQRIHLAVGHYYYRFASGTTSREAIYGGGWWIDFENLQLIRQFAESNGYSLREAARLMLALPYAWTRIDLQLRALLVQPMDAYAGYGKPAQGPAKGSDRGTRWIPTQHVRVRQLYIPGLAVKGSPSPVYRAAFAQPLQVSRLR